MDLKELIALAGGDNSVGQLAGSLGIDSSDASKLIATLSPALLRGFQKQGEASGGLDVLQDVLKSGSHQKYIDQPDLMKDTATRDDGNKILGHLFGEKEVSRQVAAKASEKTGLDTSLIKQALPMIAGLAMAAMSKKSTESSSDAGGIGDLLGSLVSSSTDDGGLDDLFGLARKFL